MADWAADTNTAERPASGLAELLAVPARLPSTAPLPAIERLAWPLAWAVAVAAHAVLFYALAHEPADAMAGGGGQLLDAISVTIVSSSVLESREVDRTQPVAPAAAGTVESDDGTPDSTPDSTPAPDQRRQQKEEVEEEREKETKPSEEPVRSADTVLEVAPPKAQPPRAQAPAAAPGGASARGDAASDVQARGAAAASAGAVREYARYVSQALAKARPKGAGGHGTVKIRFVIAPSGSLASVEVAKSSGSARLDETGLAAVRLAAFPLPPAGMSVAQLTFEIPYHFR